MGAASRLLHLVHLELAALNEVDAIDRVLPLSVDLLPTEELLRLHVVVDFLDYVGAEVRKDSEIAEELNRVLQLALH